jgi:hypothetical protein
VVLWGLDVSPEHHGLLEHSAARRLRIYSTEQSIRQKQQVRQKAGNDSIFCQDACAWNQTAKVVVAKGCDVYDFKSTFFYFFRIYCKAEGWMAIIRNLVLKMEVFYESEPSSGLYLSPCTPFYILPSHRTREQNSSWAAAQDLRCIS